LSYADTSIAPDAARLIGITAAFFARPVRALAEETVSTERGRAAAALRIYPDAASMQSLMLAPRRPQLL
jgi:hypothetical protein